MFLPLCFTDWFKQGKSNWKHLRFRVEWHGRSLQRCFCCMNDWNTSTSNNFNMLTWSIFSSVWSIGWNGCRSVIDWKRQLQKSSRESLGGDWSTHCWLWTHAHLTESTIVGFVWRKMCNIHCGWLTISNWRVVWFLSWKVFYFNDLFLYSYFFVVFIQKNIALSKEKEKNSRQSF